jgi:hypothetical protein
MISEGTLPPTRECVLTGRVTDDIVKIRVECERVWKRGPGKGRWAFAVFSVLILPFWPVWALLSWALLDERREDLGHNIVVQLPLRVCGECHSRLRRLSQRRIRRLLREVPVYAQLLAEYPGARVSVADGKSQ